MKVLLVEHNLITVEHFKKMLKENSLECELISCQSGAEALEIAPKKQPDLVIMDIQQPCLHSLIVLKILKKLCPESYFLMISTPQQSMWLEKAITLGVDDYLIRPFEEAEFISRVKIAVKADERKRESLAATTSCSVRNERQERLPPDFSRDCIRKLIEAHKKLLKESAARKKAEKAWRESEERYRKIVELMPGAIIVHSKEKIIFANTAAAKLLKAATRRKLRGKSPLDFIHPEFRTLFQKQVQRLRRYSRGSQARHRHKMEAKLIKSDGAIVDVELTSTPCSYRGEAVIYTFVHNITEGQGIEGELQKAGKLEPAGILARGIAHDFNNFLATLLGNITLAKSYKDNPDKIYEKLEIMEKATLQAKELTRRILSFSGDEDTAKKVVNIEELIVNSTCFVLSGSKVSCEFSFSEGLLPLKIDEAQIGQVLNNLILNALQAMPRGGTIRIRAENVILKASQEERCIPLPAGKYVKISVQDEGFGIPEENRQKIFEPFFSTKPGGSGLGLATSLAIVKQHNGYIDLRSEVGAGTTFYIYLPAAC